MRRSRLGFAPSQHRSEANSDARAMASWIMATKDHLRRGNCQSALDHLLMSHEEAGSWLCSRRGSGQPSKRTGKQAKAVLRALRGLRSAYEWKCTVHFRGKK